MEHFKGSASDTDREINSPQGKRDKKKIKWMRWEVKILDLMRSRIADNEMPCNIFDGLKTGGKSAK